MASYELKQLVSVDAITKLSSHRHFLRYYENNYSFVSDHFIFVSVLRKNLCTNVNAVKKAGKFKLKSQSGWQGFLIHYCFQRTKNALLYQATREFNEYARNAYRCSLYSKKINRVQRGAGSLWPRACKLRP